MKIIFFSILSISCFLAYSQEVVISYGEATPLSDVINSEKEEVMPLISKDGENIFFVRDEGVDGKGGQEIHRATKNNEEWMESSKTIKKLNNKLNNAVVGISQDGNTVYLVNTYKKKKGITKGLALSHLEGEKWSKPELVEIPELEFKPNQYYGFFVSPDEKVMIISMANDNGEGMEDLHISLKESEAWSAPKSLGETVNSSGFEMSPYISPDNSRIYFSSNGFGGSGDADIFFIERIGDGWFSWGEPVNLGANINSSGFDAYFSISKDSLAYFSSNRNGGKNDIYSSKIIRTVIEEPVVEEPVDEDIREQNIIYKIQVGAFENPKNFASAHLDGLGNIETLVLENGMITFMVGKVNSLEEAVALKSRVIEKGQKDAFIIAFLDGKRVYPGDIGNEGNLD